MVSRFVIPVLWIAWLAYWVAASRNVKATRWEESPLARAIYMVPLLAAALLLLWGRGMPGALGERFVPKGDALPPIATILVAAGLGFAVWARRHLGRNWSGNVTLKEGHTLVRSGPYRSVRHPIYTGLLLGLAGTALAVGEWRGLLALPLAFASFWYKSRIEEAKMAATFAEYEAYRRETAALIPFIF